MKKVAFLATTVVLAAVLGGCAVDVDPVNPVPQGQETLSSEQFMPAAAERAQLQVKAPVQNHLGSGSTQDRMMGIPGSISKIQ